MAPHHPWTPLEKYSSLYNPKDLPVPDRRLGAHGGPSAEYSDGTILSDAELQRMQGAYYAMVTQLDANVGRLLAELESLGIGEETVVLFTSDHDDYNGRHGLIRKGAGYYDDILRVPMFVRLPNAEMRVHEYDGNTQHEDLAPTMLELVGSEVPRVMQGHSFAEALRGRSNGARKYSYFDSGTSSIVGVADTNYKLALYDFGQKRVLTCPSTDPSEMENIVDAQHIHSKRQELENALFKWTMRTMPWRAQQTHGY